MEGLFVLGVTPDRYRLPHPRLGLPVILLVRRALLRAFEILRERQGSLADLLEDELTAALHGVLENDLRQAGSVAGFDGRAFEPVIRQAEVANFDQKRLGKCPDLCFRIRRDDEEPRRVLAAYDALFVECKPVDKTHAAGSRYCDQGLQRFVDGDYAWAMEEGLVLGYARHQRTIAGHLLPAIEKPGRRDRLRVVEPPAPVDRTGTEARSDAEALHASRHRREFHWPDDKGPATEIVLYHSWHDCD